MLLHRIGRRFEGKQSENLKRADPERRCRPQAFLRISGRLRCTHHRQNAHRPSRKSSSNFDGRF